MRVYIVFFAHCAGFDSKEQSTNIYFTGLLYIKRLIGRTFFLLLFDVTVSLSKQTWSYSLIDQANVGVAKHDTPFKSQLKLGNKKGL